MRLKSHVNGYSLTGDPFDSLPWLLKPSCCKLDFLLRCIWSMDLVKEKEYMIDKLKDPIALKGVGVHK